MAEDAGKADVTDHTEQKNAHSVIKLAQFLSALTASQDMWGEITRAVSTFLELDVTASCFREEAEGLKIVNRQWKNTAAGEIWNDIFNSAGTIDSDRITPNKQAHASETLNKVITETMESGFFSTAELSTPAFLSVVVLPISLDGKTEASLLIGKIGSGTFTKTGLNLFLAVTGLVETTITRLKAESELRKHRHRLQELVEERTEELRNEMERRKRVEEELIRIFESMEDRIYTVNRKYEIEYMNPAFIKDFGFNRKNKCYVYLNGREEVCPWCRLIEILEGKTVRWEWYCLGTNKTYDMVSTPLHNENGSISMLNIFRDITERKRGEEQRKLLLREVHHRIKNNMATVKGILSLQADSVEEPAARQALEAAENRISSMMLLYDKLYRNEVTGSISMKDYLNILVDEIIGTYQKDVSVVLEVENLTIPAAVAGPLGIIVNEVISNAMKYAFQGKKENILEVTATKDGNRVIVIVRDNGIGFDPREYKKGFGTELIELLSEQINGTFRIERDEGTRCSLEFEIA